MPTPTRRIGFLAAGAVVVALFYCSRPPGDATPGSRATEAEPKHVPPAPAFTRLAELRRRRETVIADLRAGRITLVQAADAYRTLDPDPSRANLRKSFAGTTDAERYCRQIIQHVAAAEHITPDGQVIAPNLEAELNDSLARGRPLTAEQ